MDIGHDTYGMGNKAYMHGSRIHEHAAESNPFRPSLRFGTPQRRGHHLRDFSRIPRRSGLGDGYIEPSARSGITRDRESSLPFGVALKELHRKLEAAGQVYSSFESEFENDVASIKKYATVGILENLWVMKAKGGKDRRASSESQDGYESGTSDHEDKFLEFKAKISQALGKALSATINEGTSDLDSTRHQSMVRLKEKIQTANRQILPLLGAVSKGQEQCKALTTELEFLSSLIDPASDNSKRLFKYDDDTEYVEESSPMADVDTNEVPVQWV